MEYVKTKSAYKYVESRGTKLKETVKRAMAKIAGVVGGTLGPGGHPVLIERQEWALPPMVTKDGVTVFRSLGFRDPIEHAILESARDASVRTAQEAGDGTTTATVLAEALVRYTFDFCDANPGIPSIKVIKTISNLWKDILEPELANLTIPCDVNTEEGKNRLLQVANISANGDAELAKTVMECFELTGDEGNVTIVEVNGPQGCEAERIKGFPIVSGYEESCAKFYSVFINDPANQRVLLEKPIFILNFGRINDIQTVRPLLNKIQVGWMNYGKSSGAIEPHNVVLIATGFSETVLAALANYFADGSAINIFPLVVPQSNILNSQRHFLDDVAALTSATVFEPVTRPVEQGELEDVGNLWYNEEKDCWFAYDPVTEEGITQFECGRYRSTITGIADSEAVLKRAEEVKIQVENAVSEYDKIYLQERMAKLSGGIAKLKVIGASNGELKERRDRAEDAVCAVRGAIKHGALVGGGWTLRRLDFILQEKLQTDLEKKIYEEILFKVLASPYLVLLSNAGFIVHSEEHKKLESKVVKTIQKGDPLKAKVIDVSTGEVVVAAEAGILDSAPAVRESMKNAISIATLLGTLGGCVVFPRDEIAERTEARDSADFERMSNQIDVNEMYVSH